MAAVFDLTALEAQAIFTGSWHGTGNSAGASPVVAVVSASFFSTGSWLGLANTWGGIDLTSSLTGSTTTGSWGGVAYSYGSSNLVTESYDRFTVTSNVAPNVNQGIGPGEWNPFPIPPANELVVTDQRDLTRYRKSYSSQRMQPRKIRIVRR